MAHGLCSLRLLKGNPKWGQNTTLQRLTGSYKSKSKPKATKCVKTATTGIGLPNMTTTINHIRRRELELVLVGEGADANGTETRQLGPLNEPILRKADLNENSTFYDAVVAAPSDEELHKMWLGWSILFFLVALITTCILLPVLFTKKTRKSPFNLYLIYMMVPDSFMTWACGISCLANYLTAHYTDAAWTCYFQSFYTVVMFSSNLWLNAIVAWKLLVMLKSSKVFRKYQPPTHLRVTQEAIAVYLFSAFVGSWGIVFDAMHWEWFPHKTRLTMGAMCIPQPYNDESTIFFYLVYLPAIMLIPLTIVIYGFFVIWKQQLLPPSGRRRTLAIYFFRLALAFVLMWTPCFVLLYLASPWTHPWVQWLGAAWGHMQASVSALISLLKPDIWDAFVHSYKDRACGCFLSRLAASFAGTNNDSMDDNSSYITAFWRTTSHMRTDNMSTYSLNRTTSHMRTDNMSTYSLNSKDSSKNKKNRTTNRLSLENEVAKLKADIARWEQLEATERGSMSTSFHHPTTNHTTKVLLELPFELVTGKTNNDNNNAVPFPPEPYSFQGEGEEEDGCSDCSSWDDDNASMDECDMNNSNRDKEAVVAAESSPPSSTPPPTAREEAEDNVEAAQPGADEKEDA